jgi:hypothetical protein
MTDRVPSNNSNLQNNKNNKYLNTKINNDDININIKHYYSEGNQ